MAVARFAILLLLLLPGTQAQLMPSPHTAACYLDIDGDAGRGFDEPVYLQVSCTDVRAGDVRLTHWRHHGGTIVHGLHNDAGLATTLVAATYAYFDADGSGSYGPRDDIFLAFGAIPGPLRVGDIPLVGPSAFQPINATDGRIGRPLLATSVAVGAESYAERDGNPGYTTGDIVYLDLDGNGQITIGDLRLTVVPSRTTTSTTTTSTTIPTSTTATTDTTSSATQTTHEPTTTPTRDASAGHLIVPLLAFLAWARRSH